MDAIKAARELGRAIQADERYKNYFKAKDINDADETLQALIGEFNLLRQKISQEISKPDEEKDNKKIEELNAEAQAVYADIMENKSMAEFTEAKYVMDKLIQEISGIISLCCDGEDPDTCEVKTACSGTSGTPSSSCGGCTKCG
jgi:cell fate (sporulation/competence/biofilm development) regulator YlbF (YheA/YmcA/DUF963 family)